MAPWTCNKMAIQWQRWLQAKSCHNQPQSRKNWLQLKCHSWPYKQRNEKHKTSSKSKRIMIITDTCSKEKQRRGRGRGSVQMKRWSWQTAKWRKERERVPKSILSPLEWDCKVFVFILCSSSKKNIKKTFGKTKKKNDTMMQRFLHVGGWERWVRGQQQVAQQQQHVSTLSK